MVAGETKGQVFDDVVEEETFEVLGEQRQQEIVAEADASDDRLRGGQRRVGAPPEEVETGQR